MKLVELPVELLCSVVDRIKDIPSLSCLAGTSRLMRSLALEDKRLLVLYECHQVMTAKSNLVDKEQPNKSPFSNDVRRLYLVPAYNTHRYALYAIQRNFRWLGIDEVEIRGDIDQVAGVKLRELFESPHFKPRRIRLSCCVFYDDDYCDGAPLVGLLGTLFHGKCAHMTFERCAFEPESLKSILSMLATSDIKAFHFKYNFTDAMPVADLCRIIRTNPNLVDVDMSSVGMGWDHHFLLEFLSAVAASNITHLALRHNDLGLDFPANIALPKLPNLKCLDLVGNSLYSINTTILRNWLDSLNLAELILDKTGIKDIHQWPYPIIEERNRL